MLADIFICDLQSGERVNRRARKRRPEDECVAAFPLQVQNTFVPDGRNRRGLEFNTADQFVASSVLA